MGWDWNGDVTCDACGWKLKAKVYDIKNAEKSKPLRDGGGYITEVNSHFYPAWCPTCQDIKVNKDYRGPPDYWGRFNFERREDVKKQYWLPSGPSVADAKSDAGPGAVPQLRQAVAPVSAQWTSAAAATSGGAPAPCGTVPAAQQSAAITPGGALWAGAPLPPIPEAASTNVPSAAITSGSSSRAGMPQLPVVGAASSHVPSEVITSGSALSAGTPQLPIPGAASADIPSAAVTSSGAEREGLPQLPIPGAVSADSPAAAVLHARDVEVDPMPASGTVCDGNGEQSFIEEQGPSSDEVLVLLQRMHRTQLSILEIIQTRLPPP
jgi:hypothetical protein